MKRIAFFIAIALLSLPLSGLWAGGGPTHEYEAAKLGLILPDDTEISEEDGIWNAISESEGLLVSINQTEKFVGKTITEAQVKAMCKANGVTGWEMVSENSADSLSFLYGKGSITDSDGNEFEGYFGILTNSKVKNKSYFFMVVVSSLDDEDLNSLALDVIDSFEAVD